MAGEEATKYCHMEGKVSVEIHRLKEVFLVLDFNLALK